MSQPAYIKCTGEAWWKARMRALVRDDFTCQAEGCTENDGEPETRLRFLEVHHIKSRINGGTHDLDNLMTVCKACHAKIHPWMKFDLPMTPKSFEMEMKEL